MTNARPADAPPRGHHVRPRWLVTAAALALTAVIARVLRRRAAGNPPPDGHP